MAEGDDEEKDVDEVAEEVDDDDDELVVAVGKVGEDEDEHQYTRMESIKITLKIA